MGYFFLELEGWLTFFNLKDGLLSVPSSENMAPCRDDASVSLLPNMRVIPLCQGDGRMIHLVQRVCNNVQSIWYNYNVSVMIYLVQYIWHNVPVTCNFWRPNMRVMPLCQGGGTCNHRKDSLITRTICKTQQPNISEMVINTTNGWMCCFKKENKSSNVLGFFGHIYERKASLSWQTFN